MTTQTTITEHPGAVTKEDAIPEASQSLVDEILAEQSQAESLGMVNLVHAARQAEQRIQSLMTLRAAALRLTSPIHWTIFKNPQGLVFVTPRNAAGELICQAYGIVPAPDGPPERSITHGDRAVWIQTGSAYSRVLDLSATHLRAVCIEGHNFQGRPMKDVIPDAGRGKLRPGVGDTDIIQSTMSQFRTKAAKVLSGIVTVAPAELAAVWAGMKGKPQTEEEVVKQCHMGHGFTADERGAAGQSAGTSKPATEPQRKMLFAKASQRAKELPDAAVDGGAILHECIIQVCGQDKTIESVTMDDVNKLVPLITNWGAGQ